MPLRQRTKENDQVFRERLLTAKKLPKICLQQCQSQSYFHITATINIFTKYIYACVLSLFSRDQLSVMLWTIAHQALLSMGFSRKDYWSGLPCPPPGDLPNLGIKPASLMSPALAGGFFTTSATCIVPLYKPRACTAIIIIILKSSACLNN